MTQAPTDKATQILPFLLKFTQKKWCILTLLAGLFFLNQVHSEELKEYEAKALLVYNFIKSTSWPEGSFKNKTSPIEVAVVGDQDLFKSFQPYQGKRVKGRPLKIVKLKLMTELKTEHVLYVSGKWNTSIKISLQNLSYAKKPTLTIGESEDFALNGGIISIIRKNNHLALLTNPNAAKISNLFLSRNLVKLSRQVSTLGDIQSP